MLAGGCFWCLEAAYRQLNGVLSVQSGYMGGHTVDPSYEDVCSGTTGHAEVVQVQFDPQAITYADLLEVFFTVHDPTTRDRQGNDVGTQYRSAIFYQSEQQKSAAEAAIERIDRAKLWRDPVVTEVVPAGVFYPAEEYHREYFERQPNQPHCQFIVQPKVAKVRKRFFEKLKK